MSPPLNEARLIDHVRRQAAVCTELGSPLYGELLGQLAEDVEAGGPGAELLAGWSGDEDIDAAALVLRLMGGVHRLVLARRAPDLAYFYPSVGGVGAARDAWPALRDVLEAHGDELRGWLTQPPQTNEVGRAAALVGGLLHVMAATAQPVRLVEIGASAGLNLRADRFRVELADGRVVGPVASPVVLLDSWRGVPPPMGAWLDVVERLGCDVAPVDPRSVEGRLLLTSYVWPDQVERLERLRGALEVAAVVPASVVAMGAGDFLDALELREGAVTVLWHSVMWQYLPAAEKARVTARIEELGAATTPAAGFAYLRLEPRRPAAGPSSVFEVRLRVWPDAERLLGTAAPHGVPTTWQ